MSEITIETGQDWSSAGSIRLVAVPPEPPRPAVGVNFHGLWDHYWSSGVPTQAWIAQLDALKAAGVSLLRVDYGCDRAMPTSVWNPDASYNKRLAALLGAAEGRGMGVMLALQQSPEWTRPGTGTSVKQYPTNFAAWKTLLGKLVTAFGPYVESWQVWNEPNLSAFTGVSGDHNAKADRYVPVLKASYEGIKAADPGARVVFGGPSLTDSQFMDACYYRGSKPFFDVMAWHPYQGDETKYPNVQDVYDKSRATYSARIIEHMAYWGDAEKPIRWTELGVSVHSNDGIPVSEPWRFGVPTGEQAAAHLLGYFELAKRYPQVEAVYVYVAHKTGDVHQAGYSIMTEGGTWLPQLQAIHDYTT